MPEQRAVVIPEGLHSGTDGLLCSCTDGLHRMDEWSAKIFPALNVSLDELVQAYAVRINTQPKLYAALLSVCPYCNGDLDAEPVNDHGYHRRPGANQEDECYLTPGQRDVLAEARGETGGAG